ncbi:hypothetical protein [Paenibacillus sp. HB172176]|uniref:coiled-coil domain-containing protein n=1 Tax=Paenibacillus sp. HB172176 TaxID=2493690 RepID=UPI00143BD5AD|nr:hypothetical protein [Paenibacillus sp. HB172176]
MPEFNYRTRLTSVILLLLISLALAIGYPAYAETLAVPNDDIHDILEKSLSVVEIDKEIARLEQQQADLRLTMTDTEQQLSEQEEQISDKRDGAGKVLRAYYMGERDGMYGALLNADSLTHFFQVLDFIDLVISNDKHTLNSYIDQYHALQERYTEMGEKQAGLILLENRLKQQRERVLALESQVDEQLEGRSDSERIRLLMEELTNSWQTAGLKEVQSYFKALSKAMGKLPEWIQDNKDLLETKGFQYTIRIPEEKLNAFLIEQDKRFSNFSFHFEDNKITASGSRDGMDISVIGHYTIENEKINGIIFHVDELIYNGFSLPDTTRASLEQEFDLGFYPGKILKFLKANDVETTDGELIIKLSINL